ncbi:MAG: hypothetical protein QXP36_13170, partial [Conexivisphaerales archaeon]
VSILLGLVVWIEDAKAVMLIMDDGSSNVVRRDCVSNIQPLDDFWPNLTMPTFRFKHRFPIDYSSGSFGDDAPPLGDCGCSDIVSLKGNRILLFVMIKERIIFSDVLWP